MEVVVPPGVSAGGEVEFEGPDGLMMTTTVPEGFSEGDTFTVPVDPFDSGAAATDSDIMQAFTTWFQREAVGEQVDRFVVENAAKMAALGNIEPGGEHSHEWWPLYQQYQQQFDGLLQSFLDEAGCSTDAFLEAANSAEGMEEVYVKLFLAHSEYSMFVELMSMEALKQAAENELGG